MQRHVQMLALAALSALAAAQQDSDNVFGATLGKCDRSAYFAANPDQRDTRHPTTGYFRNNGAPPPQLDLQVGVRCSLRTAALTLTPQRLPECAECTASSGDAGAHFVCVTMPNATTAAGEVYSTFWVETGQAASGEAAVTWPKPVSTLTTNRFPGIF